VRFLKFGQKFSKLGLTIGTRLVFKVFRGSDHKHTGEKITLFFLAKTLFLIPVLLFIHPVFTRTM
jgi:hypothetical protein